MLVFTTLNTVRLSLMQVGAVAFGILATATSYKLLKEVSLAPSGLAVFLMDYGFLLLAVPAVWVTLALRWKDDPAVSDGRKALIFLGGLGLLAALVVMDVFAAGTPWWRLVEGWGGG